MSDKNALILPKKLMPENDWTTKKHCKNASKWKSFSHHAKITDIITQEMRKELNSRIVYIPYTSDQFQPLVLVIFGVTKNKQKKCAYQENSI